jgi:hypothetical protein
MTVSTDGMVYVWDIRKLGEVLDDIPLRCGETGGWWGPEHEAGWGAGLSQCGWEGQSTRGLKGRAAAAALAREWRGPCAMLSARGAGSSWPTGAYATGVHAL